MNTPVFSKKQQKKALSGKKGPAKGLRNVLAQPYEFSWPIIKNENVDELKLLLEKSMPTLRRLTLDIPWAKLHKMKKSERQEARKDARLKLAAPPPDENILHSVVMGVNGVTRLLEQDNASCVILEANVEPMLMIKHIVSMADLRNVSTVLVPSLKNVMLEAVGFACAAIALKKTVAGSEDHQFYNLYKKVVEFAENLGRSRPLRVDVEPATARSSIDLETINPDELSHKEGKVVPKKLFRLSTDVYKYRNSRKERVFVPDSGTGSEIVRERLGGDFISIGKELGFQVSDNGRLESKKKTRYVDVHKEDEENTLRVRDDRMQVDDDISTDHHPKSSNTDSKILYETKLKVFGETEKSPVVLENKKSDQNFRYHSLKVKRLQGNPKRVKATKVPKKNKK